MFSRLGKLFGGTASDTPRTSNMAHSDADILAALGSLIDPDTGKPYRKGLSLTCNDSSRLALSVTLPYPAQSRFAELRTLFTDALAPFADGRPVEVTVSSQITSHTAQRGHVGAGGEEAKELTSGAAVGCRHDGFQKLSRCVSLTMSPRSSSSRPVVSRRSLYTTYKSLSG